MFHEIQLMRHSTVDEAFLTTSWEGGGARDKARARAWDKARARARDKVMARDKANG